MQKENNWNNSQPALPKTRSAGLLQQNMEQKQHSTDDMSTLLSCMKKAKEDGYSIQYTVTEEGLCREGGNRFYKPDNIVIDNFYRFEGASDPSENSILYLIQTHDGEKGILVNAYGTYADPLSASFVEQVEEISKKIKQ